MAGKRKETVLQVTVTTEEDWATLLQRKGIIVVDVYSNWCGPCKPVVRHLQRMKNEIAEDELLHFATAESDSLEDLKEYRGQCQTVFLLYHNAQVVEKVEGPKVPAIQKAIKDQLTKVKRQLKEGAE
ncbi:thioredoxin domain-containing protein 6-like isoform X1 [Synchiropus splendidus]|uniref:thioredoxin domain-containing protein 6-like isoform X1 n=1 Tax=Synchiropus splendidus TaxID=270530 RepID=UPI00237E8BB7|nr:thioredoxin domain-containing protein 6-like isoform X1 [Synchiropus splendidus]